MSRFTYIAAYTLIRKECQRIFRVWAQTLLPPAITTSLYFIIFGELIGQRLGLMHGVTYSQYIAPGLIMLAVITNTYSHVSSSVYMHRFSRHIEEILVSPMSDNLILSSFICCGIVRGLISGILVTIVALGFTHLTLLHTGIVLGISLLTMSFFSLIGFLNGLYANDFDGIAIIPAFVLTPLTYLGGVFYSISALPDIWQQASHFNPIFYIVNVFRYSLLGISDIPISHAFIALAIMNIFLYILCLRCMKTCKNFRQ
jgi:ABC-2 type transport system permease protein